MLRSHHCYCILCAALGLALALLLFFGSTPTLSAAAPTKQQLSFIDDVAPILKANCFACHDAKKRKGKFDMTTFAGLRKGGRTEIDPITEGKPEESYVIEVLKATNARRMPPKDSGDAVPAEQIAVIERWIKEGGKLDAVIQPEADLLRELRVRWKPPAPPTKYQYPVTITALAFTPDKANLLAGGHHEITIWDVATGKLEKRLRTRSERTYDMAFLPDGKLVVAGGRPGQEGDLKVYYLEAKATEENGVAILDGVNDKSVLLKQLLESDDAVLCLDVSADGKTLTSGGTDRLVHVWDLSNGLEKAQKVQTIENHADWVFDVKLAPDGQHLLTCSRDKTAKVWDLKAKQSVMTFPSHQEPVYGITVKPDSKVGFSVGEDKQLRSWNLGGNRKQIRATGGFGATVFKVVHHPKENLIATCSADKNVRLHDTNALRATKTLTGHTDWVYEVVFSADGELIASSSYNGEIRIWKVADGKEVSSFNGSPFLTTSK